MKVACILFCLVIVAPCVLGLTLQVEPKSKECFSELYPRHRNLNFNWQVIRGGLLDINVQIRYDGPEQRPFDQPEMLFEKLYFEKDHAPGSFDTILKKEGIYTICFDNTMSRFTAKVVRFDTIVQNKWGMNADDDDQDPSEVLEPMEKSAKRISEELETLSVHQQYMRNRGMRHAWTQQSTNSRIFWLSVLESIVLLSISFAQVYYIKRFFKSNNRLI